MSRSSPRDSNSRRSPPATPGEHDVVHGAAEALADRLHVVERDLHAFEAAAAPDRDVDRRARRDRVAIDERRQRASELAGALERALRRPHEVAHRARDLRGLGRALVQRVDEQAAGARRRLDDPTRRLEERGVRREVEQHGRDIDAGDAVDERVVRLLDQPDVAALEPLDEPQLPERPRPVEELRLDPRGEREQLLAAARRRQRGEAHVVRDVEARVVDPDRPTLLERHVHDPLAEPRDEVQPGADEPAGLREAEPAGVVEERSALEDADGPHVHRRLEPLQVQERRVERTQPVVARHARDGTGSIRGEPSGRGSAPLGVGLRRRGRRGVAGARRRLDARPQPVRAGRARRPGGRARPR